MGFGPDEMVGEMGVEGSFFPALADRSSGLENTAAFDIRQACTDDLDGIVEVEGLSYTNPWSATMLNGSLCDQKALNFVALDRTGQKSALANKSYGLIVGFILNLLVVDELHILNIAVSPYYRKNGIGDRLLEISINTAKQHGVKVALLEVRRTNFKALTLYIKHDFRVVGVRRGYYSDNREDAMVMKKSI